MEADMEEYPQISIESFIDASPAEVWDVITDKTLIGQWLMETNIEPIVGFEGYFKMKPMPGFNGVIASTVIQVEVNKIFAYTWQGGWMKKPTTVKFTLTPKGGGTAVLLEHWGFEGILGTMLKTMMSGGWKSKIKVQIVELIKAKK